MSRLTAKQRKTVLAFHYGSWSVYNSDIKPGMSNKAMRREIKHSIVETLQEGAVGSGGPLRLIIPWGAEHIGYDKVTIKFGDKCEWDVHTTSDGMFELTCDGPIEVTVAWDD